LRQEGFTYLRKRKSITREDRDTYTLEEPSSSIVEKIFNDIAKVTTNYHIPRKGHIFDANQEERMMYGHRDIREVTKSKVKEITFIDVILKRESSLKNIKKHKDTPTLVDLKEQGD
jgi:hypothetical protein